MYKKEEMDFIFGVRPLIEAIQSGKAVNKILVCSQFKTEGWTDLLALIKENGIPIQNVPLEKLKKITRQNHQGVIGYMSPVGYHELDQLIPTIFESGKAPLLLILDRITDVRNFGAISRAALCMNVDGIIIAKSNSAQITADAIKASAGSLFKIPVCRVDNLVDAVHLLRQSGINVISCTEKTDQSITEIDFSVPSAIVMGSEETGIQNAILNNSDNKGKININEKLGSLNVSVAAGIVLYEVRKQRT